MHAQILYRFGDKFRVRIHFSASWGEAFSISAISKELSTTFSDQVVTKSNPTSIKSQTSVHHQCIKKKRKKAILQSLYQLRNIASHLGGKIFHHPPLNKEKWVSQYKLTLNWIFCKIPLTPRAIIIPKLPIAIIIGKGSIGEFHYKMYFERCIEWSNVE